MPAERTPVSGQLSPGRRILPAAPPRRAACARWPDLPPPARAPALCAQPAPLQPASLPARMRKPAAAGPGPASSRSAPAPPACAPARLAPAPAADLSREPSGGARRPRDPARIRRAAKPQRGDRGRGRRTPGHPRSGAAEEAAAPPGSGVGPGERPEPTTSCLPWFTLRPPCTAPPHGAPVGCGPRRSGGTARHWLSARYSGPRSAVHWPKQR